MIKEDLDSVQDQGSFGLFNQPGRQKKKKCL